MASEDRARTSWGAKIVAVGILVVAAWIALRVTFATARLAFALAGYIIVAFIAYHVGKWVGRHSGPDEP